MRAHRVAEAAGRARKLALERGIIERLHAAAVVADKVMMMVSVGLDGLESRDAVPDVDPLHERVLDQRVEHPVDAGDPEPAPVRTDAPEDLVRRDAARLPVEEPDDGGAGTAAA